MKSYKELIVWQKGMEFSKEVYLLSIELPKEEIYVLSDQLRRAAVSIPSNIAEGYGRHSAKDYIRFLNIARGSMYEAETQLEIGIQLGYFTEAQTEKAFLVCEEIGRLLNALIKKLSISKTDNE